MQPPPQTYVSQDRSKGEMGLLYATAAAWGVSVGVWIDLEAGVQNPGAALIAPVAFGVAAPTTMFFLDRPKMRLGRPAAISAGVLIGAGENALIFSRQYVTSDAPWGAVQYFRGNMIASTVGGVGGFLAHYALKFKPQTTAFVSSGAMWGSLVGAAFGGAASSGTWTNTTNDSVFLGSLIGYNVVLAGTIGASAIWTPSWNQLGWMWGGFGAGAAISALVYPFYALTDADPRTGLYAQGIVAPLGAVVGALIGSSESASGNNAMVPVEDNRHPKFARILGPTILPVQAGAGIQLVGELY
jgi:hypothetical protein